MGVAPGPGWAQVYLQAQVPRSSEGHRGSSVPTYPAAAPERKGLARRARVGCSSRCPLRGARTRPGAEPSHTWLPTPVESTQSELRRTRRLARLRSQHTKADFDEKKKTKAAESTLPDRGSSYLRAPGFSEGFLSLGENDRTPARARAPHSRLPRPAQEQRSPPQAQRRPRARRHRLPHRCRPSLERPPARAAHAQCPRPGSERAS